MELRNFRWVQGKDMDQVTYTKRLKACTSVTVCICLAVGMILLMVGDARADIPQSGTVLQSIVDQFSSAAGTWEPILRKYALGLFWLLAGIEFAWTGIKLVLEGADLKQFAGELVRRILFIGFFLAVLLNAAAWSKDIVQSLWQAGAAASGAAGGVTTISPDNVFTAGLNVANQISQNVSWWHAESSLALLIAALIIIIVFALLAAMLLLVLIEMYIAINGGVILLGFGGCSWTSDFAKKYLLYCVSVGMKLMVIQLLIGLGQQMIMNWCDNIQNIQQSNQQILAIIGASIAMLALVKGVPDIIQGLVTGVTVNAHTGVLTAAAVVGATALAGTGIAAGAGMAVKEAVAAGWHHAGVGSMAGAGEGASPPGGSLSQGFRRVANATYLGAGQFGRAAMTDVGRRMSGENRGFGTMGGRMAAIMREGRLGSFNTSNSGPGSTSGDGKPGNGPRASGPGNGDISPGEKK